MKERALTLGDIDALLALQQDILRELPHKDWLAETEREQLAYMLSGGGYGLGLFDGEKLLGAWLLYYPFGREDNLAGLIGGERNSTAHYELALLDRALRGQGLHRQMVERLTVHAARDGRFTRLAATVHPDNAASLRGFLRGGFAVADTREMYGGVLRHILIKPLQNCPESVQ